MKISDLQKTSLVDYPGKICSTIFLSGCNFRCSYCHNPGLVLDDGSPGVMEDWVLRKLEERKGLVDGVCITGGEPTLHKDLPELIKKIKDKGLKVKLDTNGTNPEMLKYLIDDKLVDFIAMDVKNIFEKYELTTSSKISPKMIKESINTIIESGIEHEFRTTVLPRLHKKEDMVRIAKEYLKDARKYVLQQFIASKKMLNQSFTREKKFSEKELEEIRRECDGYVKTEIRNL